MQRIPHRPGILLIPRVPGLLHAEQPEEGEVIFMRIRWRGFELPTHVTLEKETGNDRYGKFVAEPFERGYGVTVGNSLRRVLLSSLEGAAVQAVRAEVAHKED